MKKVYILILFMSVFTFSCTRHSQIIKSSRFIYPNNTQLSDNQSSSAAQKTKATHHISASENKVFYAPVINPPFKNSLSYRHKSETVETLNGKIKISVENMPLNEFINLVFGKTLKTSYFLDKNLQRRIDLVTLKMENPLPYSKFLDMISGVLSRYGVSVQKKNNMFFIVPGRYVKKVTPAVRFLIGRNIPQNLPDNERVIAIIPFYYVNASRYRNLVKSLALSKQAHIGVLQNSNSLMITDKVANIKEALKIINLFDRLTFKHKSIVILPLNYIDPTGFIKKLDRILPLEGIPVSSKLSNPGIIMIPMPAISSIMLVSSKKEWINVVSFWKDKLDTLSALGNQPRFFVYYPKNRRASDLAKVFSQISSSITLKKNKKLGKKQSFATTSSNIKVIVDNGRNALVILAPPAEYKQIKNVLDKLDTLPKEVLVQVTIAEITLTNKLQYGIEWYLNHTGRYSGVLQTVGGLGLGSAGINYSLISDTQKFKALLNAYAHKNLINIISSPRLVVLDNKEATINVGTQVPTVTSEANSGSIQDNGTTSLLRTITYRNTGVILNIKPTINSGGILTLTIHQEVSEPQINNTSKIDSPLILNREISTSVVLKSGTTLLLGGLIKKNNSSTVNKVPILGDIPILGSLFKTISKGTTKTELIIEITPYIISNIKEAQTKTKNFESLIKWFKAEKASDYITK